MGAYGPHPLWEMDKAMTIRNRTAYWQLGATLTALSVALTACDDNSDTRQDQDTGTVVADAGDDPDAPAEDGDTPPEETVPATTPACPGIYDQLGDRCGTCVCAADMMLAPACQGPCWDFITCASISAKGPCAEAAAGGAAQRPELEACTLEQCGSYLAVPGASIVRSYRDIINACAVGSASGPSECAGDLARFAVGFEK
jgi:hypothetical protein